MNDDMAPSIVPKSDQLNADDLLTGPITIKVTGVTIHGGQEQPVAISYEGDHGKPYKACKSMCRVLVSAWGADSSKYVGRSLTLYCDPKVKWGGMEVGGIRISHMSHIDSAITMALTVTRANKKPFTVKPLNSVAPQSAQSVAVADPETAAAQVPELATTGGEPNSSLSPATAAAHTQRIKTALSYASKTVNSRFAAKLAASGIKSVEDIPESKSDTMIKWIEAQIDKEADKAAA